VSSGVESGVSFFMTAPISRKSFMAFSTQVLSVQKHDDFSRAAILTMNELIFGHAAVSAAIPRTAIKNRNVFFILFFSPFFCR